MEIIANAVQTVADGANVLFTDTVVDGCDLITHRENSGLVKVYPTCNKCYTKFRVSFSGNISVPTTGTAQEIGLAISIDGEPVSATLMAVTPRVVDAYFNVAGDTYVYAKRGCCATIAVTNTSGEAINVRNANLIVTLG